MARLHEIKKKEKVANEKNREKPKAVLEKERRDEGLGAALSTENKGFSMLAKMGYKPGMAIGKSGLIQRYKLLRQYAFLRSKCLLLHIQYDKGQELIIHGSHGRYMKFFF